VLLVDKSGNASTDFNTNKRLESNVPFVLNSSKGFVLIYNDQCRKTTYLFRLLARVLLLEELQVKLLLLFLIKLLQVLLHTHTHTHTQRHRERAKRKIMGKSICVISLNGLKCSETLNSVAFLTGHGAVLL